MSSNVPFRIARGLAVVVAIVVTHFVIVWLFQNMKLKAPDLGPVYATISVEEPSAAAPKPSATPAPAPTARQAPQKAPPKREKPAAPSAPGAGNADAG